MNPPGGAARSVPDIPNWAWHEYGQRVGFWRIKAIFDDFGVAGSPGKPGEGLSSMGRSPRGPG